jgi:hypothetical protein
MIGSADFDLKNLISRWCRYLCDEQMGIPNMLQY